MGNALAEYFRMMKTGGTLTLNSNKAYDKAPLKGDGEGQRKVLNRFIEEGFKDVKFKPMKIDRGAEKPQYFMVITAKKM